MQGGGHHLVEEDHRRTGTEVDLAQHHTGMATPIVPAGTFHLIHEIEIDVVVVALEEDFPLCPRSVIVIVVHLHRIETTVVGETIEDTVALLQGEMNGVQGAHRRGAPQTTLGGLFHLVAMPETVCLPICLPC